MLFNKINLKYIFIILIIFIIFLLFFLKQKENFTWTCGPVELPGSDSEGRVLRINESLFSTKNQGYHIKEISNINESGDEICTTEKNIDDYTYKSNNLCILFYNSKSDNYPGEINNFMAPTPISNQDTNKVFGGFGKIFGNKFVYESEILTEDTINKPFIYGPASNDNSNYEGSIIFDFKFKFLDDDKKILIDTEQEQDLINSQDKSFRIFFRNTKDKGLRLGVFNNSLPKQTTNINKIIHGNSLDPREKYMKILYSNKEFNKLDHNKFFRCAITFKYVKKNNNDKNLSVNMILEDKDVFNKFGINEPKFIGKTIFSFKEDYKFMTNTTNLIININEKNYILNQTESGYDTNQVIFNNKFMNILDYKQSYLTGESRNLIEGVIHSFNVHKRFLNGYFYDSEKSCNSYWGSASEAKITNNTSKDNNTKVDNIKTKDSKIWQAKTTTENHTIVFEFDNPVTIDGFRTYMSDDPKLRNSSFSEYKFDYIKKDLNGEYGLTYNSESQPPSKSPIITGVGKNLQPNQSQNIMFDEAITSIKFKLTMTGNYGKPITMSYFMFHFTEEGCNPIGTDSIETYKDVSMIFRAFDCNIFNEFCECEKITYYPTLRFYQVNNNTLKKVFDYPLGKNIHWQWVSSWMMGWDRYNIDKIEGNPDDLNNTRQSGYDEGSKLGESEFSNSDQNLKPIPGAKYKKKLDLYDGSHRWSYWPRVDATDSTGESSLEFIENSINCI